MEADNTIEKIDSKPLLNKNSIITGTSRGIGLKTARLFASAGSSLVLTEIPERINLLEKQACDIRETFGVDVITFSLDVREHKQIQEVVKTSEDMFGNIDILVNNAGINLICSALTLTPEAWDLVLDINLKGSFFMAQEVAKNMIKNKSGSIISIASQHGMVGNELRAAYCSSKAGLINLTRALAMEWARFGIRVNSVSPTFVLTDANNDELNDFNFQRANLNKIPLRKYALPEDIAQAILYLASPASRMVTGHNLVVDGGWTAV